MCGIAGIFLKKNANQYDFFDKIAQMQAMLADRGPDGQATVIHSQSSSVNYYTTHTRLAIIDQTERSAQPLENERYILTYNGEIYNYKTLYSNAISDTHALLDYIMETDLLTTIDHINGMYAFALYDKWLNCLTLVRDPFGIKPLYTYDCEDYIAYASTPAALTVLKDKWELNIAALHSYLSLGAVFHQSLYTGINPLPAAYYQYVDENLNSTIRYYTPTYTPGTVDELVQECVNEIDACKLASDVPVYLFLSGGVDSTFIATRCQGMNAVHLTGCEQVYAQHAAEKCNMSMTTVDPLALDILQAHTRYVTSSGEPSMAAHIPYMTAGTVSAFAKTAISANGADELFFGYPRTPKDGRVTYSQENHIFRNPSICADQLKSLSMNYMVRDTRVDAARWFELVTYVMFDLNKTLDYASMAHGLEMRVPFLSRRIVNRALSLKSDEFFSSQFGGKAPLKKYLYSKGFSTEFVNRDKVGFSLHQQPKGLHEAKQKAWAWLHKQAFAKDFLNTNMDGRYEDYLKNSALSLMVWFEVWGDKLTTDNV